VIGGELVDIGSNAKLGTGKYMVAEADESDGSFLLLQPQYAIVTNIEDDHMDYYHSADNILAAFKDFVNKIGSEGLAIVCADDANIQQIIPQIKVPVTTYGLMDGAEYTLKNMSINGKANGADVYHRDRFIGHLELNVPGCHNLLNALAVVVLSLHIGLPFAQVANILKEFKGAKRRYQLLGEINNIKVIDDYAHHPTEVKATLQGARQTNPKRLIGIFQPHRYTRTKQLYEQFGASFCDADLLVINSIYSAGETPISGVSAELIVEAAKRHNVREVVYIEDLQQVAGYLADIAQPGDVILTMGAGNIWTAGLDLVKELKERY
jgi:UDP-N-acetylmuramate--alanine ligase